MPENQNENPNAYDYNPNRPQTNSQDSPQSNSTQNVQQNEHADTKRVVSTATKGAATYLAPGVGGVAYDTLKKAPVVGDAIDKTTDAVAEAADQVPGVKPVTESLNNSGVTNMADKAIDFAGNRGNVEAKPSTKISAKRTSNQDASPVMPIRKNNDFNSKIRSGEEMEEAVSNNPEEQLPQDGEENLSRSQLSSEDTFDNSINNEDSSYDSGNHQGDVVGRFFKKIWDRYKIPIILGGAGIFLILLILIVIFGGASEEAQLMGYMDSMCNFNETKVTVTNCYQSDSEMESLAIYNLDEFVVRLAYAYTKDETYSDDAVQAMMIALKTNILSYGNYNSSDKEVDVRICDVFSNYENVPEGSNDELWMLDATTDELTNLESLYEDISNYLYISSSYKSAISNLSHQNLLTFNNGSLDEFEELASSGNTYEQILDSVYNTNEEDTESDNTVYRETLFLGDSRMRGIELAGVTNSNNTIYGVGYGYNWLVGTGTFSGANTNSASGGVAGINSLMRENTSYNIVIWLGVNDLGNVNLYYEEYYDLATEEWSNHNIYIVSVGPVDDELSANVTNDMINQFNNTMSNLVNNSGLNNLFYIDLGYTEEDIGSFDSEGIHYGSSDYVNIYNLIVSSLDNTLNADYQLYNLNSYCTYYTLTENSAYWWPVGSSEPTQGNIYGGEPTATVITSEFGRRDTGIAGASKNHKGIDIAKNGSACGDIVIASRSGTVVKVTDNGGARGTYVIIEHEDGVETLYQHMQEGSYTVKEGDQVSQGQMIGKIGNTGVGSGCHLHFEVIVNGVEVNPLDYVDPDNPRPVESYHLGNIDDSGATPSENKEAICHALLDSGFSKNAVAGMMVNIAAEGGFRTTNLENCYEEGQCCTNNGKRYGYCVHPEIAGFGSDTLYTNGVDSGAYPRDKFVNDRAGYGLIQWTSSTRKAGLYDYAKEQNKSIGALSVQLGYLLQELENPAYALTYKYITGNYSAYDIANTFCLDFESPSNESTVCPARARNNIDEYLSYVQNGCSD